MRQISIYLQAYPRCVEQANLSNVPIYYAYTRAYYTESSHVETQTDIQTEDANGSLRERLIDRYMASRRERQGGRRG